MKSNEDLVIENKNKNSNLPNSNYYIKRKGIFKENAKFYFIIISILVILYFGIILVIGILRIIEFFISFNNYNKPSKYIFYILSMIGILPGFISFIIIFIFGLKIELDKVFKNYLINLIFLLIYDSFCYYFYFLKK